MKFLSGFCVVNTIFFFLLGFAILYSLFFPPMLELLRFKPIPPSSDAFESIRGSACEEGDTICAKGEIQDLSELNQFLALFADIEPTDEFVGEEFTIEYEIWVNSDKQSNVVIESEHKKDVTCHEYKQYCYRFSMFTIAELDSDTYRIEVIIREGTRYIKRIDFTLVRVDEDFSKNMMALRTILSILSIIAFVAFAAALKFKKLREGATVE